MAQGEEGAETQTAEVVVNAVKSCAKMIENHSNKSLGTSLTRAINKSLVVTAKIFGVSENKLISLMLNHLKTNKASSNYWEMKLEDTLERMTMNNVRDDVADALKPEYPVAYMAIFNLGKNNISEEHESESEPQNVLAEIQNFIYSIRNISNILGNNYEREAESSMEEIAKIHKIDLGNIGNLGISEKMQGLLAFREDLKVLTANLNSKLVKSSLEVEHSRIVRLHELCDMAMSEGCLGDGAKILLEILARYIKDPVAVNAKIATRPIVANNLIQSMHSLEDFLNQKKLVLNKSMQVPWKGLLDSLMSAQKNMQQKVTMEDFIEGPAKVKSLEEKGPKKGTVDLCLTVFNTLRRGVTGIFENIGNPMGQRRPASSH